MATFRCTACGNLHGAPQEHCGVCGSPALVLVPETIDAEFGPDSPRPNDPPGDGATPDAFAATFVPMFQEAFAYVRERDAERGKRCDELDALEQARRERVSHAKVELLGQTTTLVERLIELAEEATAYFTKAAPSPVVE